MTNGIGRVGWRNFVSAPTNNPLWNNLVAYYTGDNTPNDAKGTAHGNLVNGATYGTGKISNGFSLDGINDYVSIPNGTFNPTSGSYTISAWMSQSSTSYLPVIFGLGGFITNSIVVYLYGGLIRFLNSNGATYQLIESPIPSSGSYHHVLCVKDTASNKYYLYVNGSLVAQDTISINYVANSLETRIGSIGNGAHGFSPFAGIIDEVGLWNRALTATEVTELYNAGAGKQYVAPTYTTRTTAFATATGITDTTILNALNTFDTGLISNGLATKMKAVYPFVGTTATTQKFNFMDARDLNAAFRLQFNGGITFTSNGILFGGDNGFANTFVQPSTVLSLNDTHISLYSRTNNSSQVFDIQCTATPSLDIAMWGGTTFYNVNQALNYSTYSDGSTLGFRLINRTSSVSEKLFKNNSLVATVTNASTSLSPGVIDIGRYYFGGYYSNRNYAFISIGSGLTDAEALTFYNLVQAMQTSLSRAV